MRQFTLALILVAVLAPAVLAQPAQPPADPKVDAKGHPIAPAPAPAPKVDAKGHPVVPTPTPTPQVNPKGQPVVKAPAPQVDVKGRPVATPPLKLTPEQLKAAQTQASLQTMEKSNRAALPKDADNRLRAANAVLAPVQKQLDALTTAQKQAMGIVP